jgi:hypothetical protein
MYIQGSPVEIHTQAAHWNLIGGSMTAPQLVLSASSILPPSSSLSVFISERKYAVHVSKLLPFFFTF